MTIEDIRNAAFTLQSAVDHLRKYAILAEVGAETEICLQLAMNSVRAGMECLQIPVAAVSVEQMHHSIRAARFEKELRERQAQVSDLINNLSQNVAGRDLAMGR